MQSFICTPALQLGLSSYGEGFHWTKTAEAVARQDGGAKREQGGVQSFMQGGVQSFICTLVLQLGGSRPNGEGFHRTKTAEAVSRRGDATVPSG